MRRMNIVANFITHSFRNPMFVHLSICPFVCLEGNLKNSLTDDGSFTYLCVCMCVHVHVHVHVCGCAYACACVCMFDKKMIFERTGMIFSDYLIMYIGFNMCSVISLICNDKYFNEHL